MYVEANLYSFSLFLYVFVCWISSYQYIASVV